MKKVLYFGLVAVLIMSLIVGCNNKDNDLNNDSNKEIDNIYSKISNLDIDINKLSDSNTKFDSTFFINNRKKLNHKINDNSLVVLFSDFSDEYTKYTPNKSLYYLTGIDEENSILLISEINGDIKETLYIERKDPNQEKWIGKSLSMEEAKEISGIENIKYIDEFQNYFDTLAINIDNIYLDLYYSNFDNIVIEKENINYPKSRGVDIALQIHNKNENINVLNVYNIIGEIRSVKTDKEIMKIKKAIDITNEGIKSIMKNIKPNMYEYQLESHFDFTIKYLGANNFAFPTIAASGQNATILHYSDNNNLLKDEDLILLDLGAEYEYYDSDISRTLPISGKFNERQKTLYNIVLKAQEETIKSIKPGITLRELNDITNKVLAQELKEIGLIKSDSELRKYFYHGVSHSLGLETHDPGINNRPLEPGMVITIEPGLYIEEEGIGIRIEDDILVTKEGYINLSENIIKTVEEIEEFIKK